MTWQHSTARGPQERFIPLVFKNLSVGTTPEEQAEHLWMTIGIDIAPEKISCKDVGQSYSVAFVTITENVLAAFLNRYLSDQHICGKLITIETKKQKQRIEQRPADFSQIERRA